MQEGVKLSRESHGDRAWVSLVIGRRFSRNEKTEYENDDENDRGEDAVERPDALVAGFQVIDGQGGQGDGVSFEAANPRKPEAKGPAWRGRCSTWNIEKARKLGAREAARLEC
jgi:hypothetical protein